MINLKVTEIEQTKNFELYDDGDYYLDVKVILTVEDYEGDRLPYICIDKRNMPGKITSDTLEAIMKSDPSMFEEYDCRDRFFIDITPSQLVLISLLVSEIKASNY